MSGFFGIVRQDGKPVEDQLLETIANRLSFRGPDGRDLCKLNHVGGCFTWMKTGPALQASRQPVRWRDRLWLWGDLRLDARAALQQQLSEAHAPVQGNPTSEELLLRAWTQWGPACLEYIIGDFSFALWDAQEQVLWCARDFVGARPFYYAHARGVFCFSNTLQVLQCVPESSDELDESFLGDFFIEGWNVDPTRTVYRDIKRLAAGHLLKLSNSNVEIRRFRKLPLEEPLKLKDPEEYLEAYRDLLKTVVSDRLPSGPTALYLSGGLDSSSVCAIAAQLAAARNQKDRLKAFTLSWEPLFADPEPSFAKLTAEHLGVAHEILQEKDVQLFEDTGDTDVTVPEPNEEVFFARERRHSQRIAAHSNVVLSGDGGDDVLTGRAWPYLLHLLRTREWKEIARDFGGYVWTHKKVPPLRAGFRAKIRELVHSEDPFEGYLQWLNDDFVKRANLKQRWLDLRAQRKNTEHTLHPDAYASLHDGFWASVLETEDAGWNHVRLETRAPLLDLRMLRFLLRLPPVPWCVDKELCRQAMRNDLPMMVIKRPKTALLLNPMDHCSHHMAWITGLPKEHAGRIESFVNWPKWCETLYRSKGSLRCEILRPASLFRWLKAVESK